MLLFCQNHEATKGARYGRSFRGSVKNLFKYTVFADDKNVLRIIYKLYFYITVSSNLQSVFTAQDC